ncbi:single-stranded DNA binding protein [Aliarcobacter faecis]|uniref:single-stranded DNA-binding protein n=1 Tax=Aliarcobacter faecis TaxID=1564138 RepID=UPI00047EAE15|nr:single-stranded DNA-binding protein [Aliarcobacter faecis]QKF74183.1 single-stranded DNA binding protein [Aliarcobacter faecis]
MYNKVIMVGNLTRDIELRYLPSGTAVSKSAIATSYKYKSQTGEQKEEVCFLDINFFGRSAEIANQYLKKGSKVLVEGRLVFEQWTAQDGTTRNRHSLRVDEMKMLDSKGSSEGGSNYNPNSGSYNQNYNQAPQNQYNNQNSYDNFGGTSSQKQKFEQKVPEIDIEDDEIPF